jgi:glycosyltransferase involved in cell wall biosynthesis
MIDETRTWGLLEAIERRTIRGWAIDRQHPTKRLRITVLLDGTIAGFAIASQFRADLLDAGIGDGAHGFVCEVPAAKLRRAERVTVQCDIDGKVVLIGDQSIELSRGDAKTARHFSYAVHFDISDLLEYLSNFREVSGIQRVQCGYLANALLQETRGFDVKVCAQTGPGSRYVEIANAKVEELLKNIEDKRPLPLDHWRAYAVAIKAGTGMQPDFQPGDVILTMGAPWVYEGYYQAIQAAKHEHGVRYFQILYDLIPTLMPEVVSMSLIGGFNHALARMLSCVDHIFSISKFSTTDLKYVCSQLGVQCPPVSIITLGTTIDYGQKGALPKIAALPVSRPSPKRQFGDFVLCVGTLELRKNHVYLFHVWKRLQREFGAQTPKLVCVGRVGWHMEDFQRLLKVSGNLDGRFVHLSDISDSDLDLFYRDCLFTVFPSLYEGWGLPITESLMFGKICVASNVTSMPEAGGDWATYIDPYNVNDGYEKIAALLRDRVALKRRERDLRANYVPLTWRSATQNLLTEIHDVSTSLPSLPSSSGTMQSCTKQIDLGYVYEFSSASELGGAFDRLRDEIRSQTAEELLDGDDWHRLENWGCWSRGKTARLSFTRPKTAKANLSCYISVSLPYYADKQGGCVLVNGTEIGRFVLYGGKDSELRFDLPPITRTSGKTIAIELTLDAMYVPNIDTPDQRLLGLGVRSLFVCESRDLATRLQYLERRIVVPCRLSSAKYLEVNRG